MTAPAALREAIEAHAAADLDRADALYLAVLKDDRTNPVALANRARIARVRGDNAAAIALYEAALADPRAPAEVAFNLACTLHDAHAATADPRAALDRALTYLDQALAHVPELKPAHRRRADILALLGRPADAADARAAAAEQFQDDPALALEAAIALAATRRGERAVGLFRRASRSRAHRAEAATRLAALFMEQGEAELAIHCLKRLVEETPNDPAILQNLAYGLRKASHFQEALRVYGRARPLVADRGEIDRERAICLVNLGRAAEASQVLGETLRTGEPANSVSAALMASLYDPEHDAGEILRLHSISAATFPDAPAPLARPSGRRGARGRPRIGFISADFHGRHPVAQFLLPLLGALIETGEDVRVFSTSDGRDETYARLCAVVEPVALAGRTADEAAGLIHDARPDILIDLTGHCSGARFDVLARRPAPIQAQFIGYPSTTGVPSIDILFADPVLIPPEHERFYSERVARMPDAFLCFVPPDDMPAATIPDPAPGEDRPLRFGSLNALPKLNEATLALWAEVMRAVPDAELFIKCGAFAEAETRAAFAARLTALGIARERLVLEGPSPFVEAMACYRGIDIALDSLPYNGGTTTAHALAMGTPVVALAGDRFSARMGASLLTAAGRPEWIVESREAYVGLVAELARDRDGLRAARQALARDVKRSALCDLERYRRGFVDLVATICGPASGR